MIEPAKLLTPMPLALAGAVGCVLSLLIAYFFMQRYLLLPPCPLCILDRIVIGLMAGAYVVLAYSRRAAWLAWGAVNLLLAAGFVFAGRHIWLQNRPPGEAAACLSDSAAATGLIELITRAFDADADCGAIIWEFAGMTIPEQVLLLFIGFAVLQGMLAAALIKQRKQQAAAQ